MNGDVYVADENIIKEQCQNCGSIDSTFDEFMGFYQCKTCDSCWQFDDDDPDYRELETCTNCDGSGYVTVADSDDPLDVKGICSFCDSAGVV